MHTTLLLSEGRLLYVRQSVLALCVCRPAEWHLQSQPCSSCVTSESLVVPEQRLLSSKHGVNDKHSSSPKLHAEFGATCCRAAVDSYTHKCRTGCKCKPHPITKSRTCYRHPLSLPP
jgi:hypothetical protein